MKPTVSCQTHPHNTKLEKQRKNNEVLYAHNMLRGQGGSEVDFHFFVVSDRGECQLSGFFSELKNIVPSQSYRIFKSQKYIQLHCAHELQTRFPEN